MQSYRLVVKIIPTELLILGKINDNVTDHAKLIPIIPPSKGHGFNIYEELGTDRVLCYARFGGSTKIFQSILSLHK